MASLFFFLFHPAQLLSPGCLCFNLSIPSRGANMRPTRQHTPALIGSRQSHLCGPVVETAFSQSDLRAARWCVSRQKPLRGPRGLCGSAACCSMLPSRLLRRCWALTFVAHNILQYATDTRAIILLVWKDSLIGDDWLYRNPMTKKIYKYIHTQMHARIWKSCAESQAVNKYASCLPGARSRVQF